MVAPRWLTHVPPLITPHTFVWPPVLVCSCPCWPVLPAADGYPTWAVVKVAGVAGQEKILIRGVRYRDIAQLLAEIAAVSSLAATPAAACVLCPWASCATGFAAAVPWLLLSWAMPAPAATLLLRAFSGQNHHCSQQLQLSSCVQAL